LPDPIRNSGSARPDVRADSELSYREADEMVAWAVAARTEIYLAFVVRSRAAVRAILLVDHPVRMDPGPVAQREAPGDRHDDVQGRSFRITDLYERGRRFAIGQDLETGIVDAAGGARRHDLHDHLGRL
jgi:hypothetical protein